RGQRRAGRVHRRDHRRGNQLRAHHRQLPRARRADHAGLPLSEAGAVLRRRARAPVRAVAGRGPGHRHHQGQLRRRHGLGPVHAVELPHLGQGRRRRRPPRPARRHQRHLRLHRQLLRRPRLAARATGGRARRPRPGRARPGAGLAATEVDARRTGGTGLCPARRRAATGQCRGARDPGRLRRRRRPRILDRLPQLLRHHPLQPLADVRDGRAPAGAGDPRRGRRAAGSRRRMSAARCARLLVAACAAAGIAACGSTPPKPPPPGTKVVVENHGTAGKRSNPPRRSPYPPAQEDLSKRGNYVAGGLYAPGVKDSAPEGGIPDVHLIPEPEVRAEARSKYGNRSPYKVLGKSYYVRDSAEGYDEVGIASYYGSKFHGRRTSSLEVYDMYAFTAAHKTLPLPSYARVTNLGNGQSVVVRVNDRGPFHDGRIIDLSYAAAVKLGVDRAGTARVRVVGLSPGEKARVEHAAGAAAVQEAPRPAAAEPLPESPMDALVGELPAQLVASAAPVASGPSAAPLPPAQPSVAPG